MQRSFRGNFCSQNAKNNLSKTLEKSINSDQNKNFFKIFKKSVAKIVRFFCATALKKTSSFFPYRPIATNDIKPSVLPPIGRKTAESHFGKKDKWIFSRSIDGNEIFLIFG